AAFSEGTGTTVEYIPFTELSYREQAERIVSGMTLEQKIAQMITISLRQWDDTPVTELNEQQKALLTKYDFGGMILFGQNCTDTEQTVRLTAAIQEAAMASEQGIPMLISADQEGGSIVRLSKGTTTCGNMELVPFIAVADEADMIMTAHIQFPQIETATYTSIDSGEEISLPATLSKTMIKDILRGDIGYDGVVTTDAMLMDAIDTNFDAIDAAVLAINADVDILLEPIQIMSADDIAAQDEYIGKLVAAVNDGRIAESEIDDSVVRIITLKLEKGIIGMEAVNADTAAAAAKTIVGSKEHHDKELEVALRTVTLVKNDDNALPLVMQENEKVAYFYP
ncbi:MAG: hypothetical protein IK990_02455, partial [Ruminiclostridium sp.]|nr:hypothetical protein [Ruminiclostridium sp.]